MNYKLLRRIRRVLNIFLSTDEKSSLEILYSDQLAEYSGQEASDVIIEFILAGKPFMLTRFGSTELQAVIDSQNQKSIKNIFRYLLGYTNHLGWRHWIKSNMEDYSGFYPATDENLIKYGEIVINLLPQIDIFATWMIQERNFINELKNSKKIKLADIEPYHNKIPWTKYLKNKRVLIIHPFEATIRYQYLNNRNKLFENEDILPEFELLTIKAVQSLSDDKYNEFDSWFDAYEYMKSQIDNVEFDIAILGCGSYGMPLAAYIKSLNKMAIHMGGSTQYLFGIKSKRAEITPSIKCLFNEYWIRPLKEDYPKGFEKIEGGCYW